MNRNQSLTLVGQIIGNLEGHGVTVDKSIKTEYATLVGLSERLRDLSSGPNFAKSVVAALEAGEDPTGPEMLPALLRRAISENLTGIEDVLNARSIEFVQDCAPRLLKLHEKPFTSAAAVIHAAHDQFGDVPLEDTEAILKRGGDAATVWAGAQAACSSITRMLQTWKVLGTVASSVRASQQYRLLRIAEIPPATFVKRRLGRVEMSPWEVARQGYRLSFADQDALAARIAAVQQSLGQTSVDRRDAEARATRTRFGMGVSA